MNINKGRYQLLLSERIGDRKELIGAFDFTKGSIGFNLPKEDALSKVSIATIDSLTTAFMSQQHLVSYLDKKQNYDREEPLVCVIQYKSNSTGETMQLSPIWNDEKLHKVASSTDGSKLNFDDETTRELLYNIYGEITNNKDFVNSILSSTSINTKINDHNKELLKSLFGKERDLASRGRMQRSFIQYREFRALYLAYNRYMTRKKAMGSQTPGKK